MSRPLAATSVQTKIPLERAENDARAFSRGPYVPKNHHDGNQYKQIVQMYVNLKPEYLAI
jgi:hypothetical protein